MLKRLRIRFVYLVGISVFVVLFSVITVINVINFQRIAENADRILDVLAINGGHFGEKPDFEGEYSEEIPFETRFFTVKFTENGIIANTKQIAAVDDEKAIEMAQVIDLGDKTSGYDGQYRYKIVRNDKETLIIFVDWSSQLGNVSIFLIVSVLVSILAFCIIVVLAFFLSNKIIAPFAESYEKQSRFITNASHELKTPLTIISANNELIELEKGECESTKAISKQINRLTQMVGNMTVLAKIEKNSLNRVSKFSFTEAFLDVLENYDNKEKKINSNLSDDLIYYGDEGLIRQLFSILLDNAYKYSIENIEIDCSRINNKINLVISNDTLEMEEIESNRFFERFFRSQTVRSRGIEGSGIGLSIAEEIVDLHKGNIKAEQTNNKFTVKVIL